MPLNQISAFEYVSILVSIILGLGITQILSSLADLLYHHHKVKLYWPHVIWVVFIFFLHVQDWFITYQLKDLPEWNIPQLMFVLAYPILLFTCAKMLLPTNESEESYDMRKFYESQYRVIFTLVGLSVILSILFNIYILKRPPAEQAVLILFLLVLTGFITRLLHKESMHRALALVLLLAMIISVILEKDNWVIR
jgi:peptidoglycan/LPS O-acetylase OafA/YrhL